MPPMPRSTFTDGISAPRDTKPCKNLDPHRPCPRGLCSELVAFPSRTWIWAYRSDWVHCRALDFRRGHLGGLGGLRLRVPESSGVRLLAGGGSPACLCRRFFLRLPLSGRRHGRADPIRLGQSLTLSMRRVYLAPRGDLGRTPPFEAMRYVAPVSSVTIFTEAN